MESLKRLRVRGRWVEAIYEDLTIPVATRNVMLGTELDGYRSVADPPIPLAALNTQGAAILPDGGPHFYRSGRVTVGQSPSL